MSSKAPKPTRDAFDPVLGDDDGPVTIVRGGGFAAYMPGSVAKLDGDTIAMLRELQRHVMEMERMRARMDDLVLSARMHGASWSAVGWSVGTTSEAARQRWGVPSGETPTS